MSRVRVRPTILATDVPLIMKIHRHTTFGASTITLGRIKEIVEKGYFADGEARAPKAEAVPETDNDEDVVFQDFFVASLRMPPHPVLTDILLKF
jgi:hypothetical protein